MTALALINQVLEPLFIVDHRQLVDPIVPKPDHQVDIVMLRATRTTRDLYRAIALRDEVFGDALSLRQASGIHFIAPGGTSQNICRELMLFELRTIGCVENVMNICLVAYECGRLERADLVNLQNRRLDVQCDIEGCPTNFVKSPAMKGGTGPG